MEVKGRRWDNNAKLRHILETDDLEKISPMNCMKDKQEMGPISRMSWRINEMTLVTSERFISGSKMSIYEWSSPQESTTNILKNRHFPLRSPNPMLGHCYMYAHVYNYITGNVYV